MQPGVPSGGEVGLELCPPDADLRAAEPERDEPFGPLPEREVQGLDASREPELAGDVEAPRQVDAEPLGGLTASVAQGLQEVVDRQTAAQLR